MNYAESLNYIHSISWTFCKPGLDRIRVLCEALGDPQNDLKFVHVVGTNGKGSTCSMLHSILRCAGYRVGLYTSPYIRFFNERMQVNGEPISNEELAELTDRVKPVADAMDDRPTEFELITAIAFLYFKRHGCDVVVLEAGMGGRLDSTNIIRNPLLSVITGIALDHVAFLGDTVEQIAAEKAGIIKDGAPVLFGGDEEAAAEVISKTAIDRGSPFYIVPYERLTDLRADLYGSTFDFGFRRALHIGLLGTYQPRNAALAVCAAELLCERGMTISENALRRGLNEARWPGRFELLSHRPLTIFDGAHNPQGIHSAVESIKTYFGEQRVYLLTGVLRDKDYTEIAGELATVASRAFVLTPNSPRALAAEEYAEVLRGEGIEAENFGSIKDAFCTAREEAKREGIPLICLGSLYLYADLIPLVEEME